MKMNAEKIITLPDSVDPEGGPVKIGTEPYYSFIVLTGNMLHIHPN